jgi:Ca2+-binding RTX toxin-like protein
LDGVINGGGGTDDTLYGLDGNDDLSGDTGNDHLYGGDGDDNVVGGAGDDVFYYAVGDDWITDSSGTDILDISDTWTLDELSFRRYTTDIYDLYIEIDGSNSVVIDFQVHGSLNRLETLRMHDGKGDIAFANIAVETHGTSSNNSISGITGGASTNDVIYGFGGNDTITGGSGNDILYGGDGNDSLTGNDLDDTLYGEAGDDSLSGSAGNDVYMYSAGLDTVTDTGGSDALWITGGVTINDVTVSNHGTDEAKIVVTASVDEVVVNNLRHWNASNHVDTLKFDDGFAADLPSYNSWIKGTSGSETVSGNASANVLIGYAGDDTINAGASNDNAHGGAGADTISGEAGDDLLHGGEGDDVLYGGDALDTLFGGAGADTFAFESASAFNDVDQIMDFSTAANDVLDLTDILGAVYDPLTEAITDFIQITDNGTDSTFAVDADGGADNFVAVAMIRGVTGLTDEEALETSGHLLAA